MSKERIIGIYAITVGRYIYIGKSINVDARLGNHKTALKHNKHCNAYLQRVVDKYGYQEASFKLLFECSERSLNDMEIRTIRKYQDDRNLTCVNINMGGDHTPDNKGIKHSEEFKKGCRDRNIGKKLSEDTKRKMSESASSRPPNNKGKPWSASRRAKYETRYGK